MTKFWTLAGIAGLLISGLVPLSAQVNDPNSGIQYKRGQDVVPAYDGWQKNSDGTYSFWFSYFNRNYEEIVDVPVGPDNSFSPGPADRGQPTHFLQRRQMFIFRVVVPKDWGADQKLTWTITSHGKTNRAKAWLQPEWELNKGTMSENRSAGTPDTSNEFPTVTGSGPMTARVGTPITLMASATDDGLPAAKPRKQRGAEVAPTERFDPIGTIIPEGMMRGMGLNIKWIVYRGAAKVTFEPAATKPAPVKSAEISSKVTFSEPGVYVIRAIASDGALESTHDVTVTVK